MDRTGKEQESIREYLLGRLSSDDREQFEEQLLIDGELYEELVILEDELVDEYLREELSTSDRQSFESFFLASPEHQEKLRFARAFTKYLGVQSTSQAQEVATVSSVEARTASVDSREMRPTAEGSRKRSSFFGFLGIQNPALGYATAAALVLIVVGISWVVWRRTSAPRDPGRVHSVVLASGLTRGDAEGANRVRVPPDADTLRLQLILSDNRYNSYEATLLDADGRALTIQSSLTTGTVEGQPAALFDIPANLLSAGDYRVKLSAVSNNNVSESLPSYSFRVSN